MSSNATSCRRPTLGTPAAKSRFWCPATTRSARSPRWSRDFRAALPEATIYVYDNNSTDRTVERRAQAGAVVRRETHQGKGYVVRRMFNDIEADVYVLVDGDATYDAPSAPAMIAQAARRAARHGGGERASIARRRPIAAAIAPATGC